MPDNTRSFKELFITFASRTAVVDHLQQKEYSYAELEDLSSRLAGSLREHAGKETRIALFFANQIEMVIAYLACLQLGATAVPLNPALHMNEFAGILKHAEPQLILTCGSLASKLPPSSIPTVHFSDGSTLSMASLAGTERLDTSLFPYASDALLAFIMFTSGSTGTPKAIPIRLGALAEQARMTSPHYSSPEARPYLVLPLAYIGGPNIIFIYLYGGGSVVIDQAFSASSVYRFWDTALSRGANALWLTPSMVATLVAMGPEDEEQAKRIAGQFRRIIAAMGPLASHTKQQFEQIYGVTLEKSYGIVETLLCCSWQGDLSTPEASVGKPLPGVSVVIAAEDGTLLPPGSEGEIRVKSGAVLEEYYKQPELTRDAFDKAGYYRTGDLGHLDKENHLFITGRIKDVIKRGGLNVSPAEIEAVLCAIPGVRDAAVIGQPDELYGEKIIAVVTSSAEEPPSEETILKHCTQQLSSLKLPSAVYAIPRLPLTATGKPDKRAIRDMLANNTLGTL